MAGGYTALPEFYDVFGEHPDYDAYAEALLDAYREKGAKESRLILDLACGTGKLTLALAKRGAEVIGVDASPEMLTVARENCAVDGVIPPLFLMQDMRELDLYGTVDVAVCATNSLNYLESRADLQKVFALVHNFLTPGGLFLFDVNSQKKFEEAYGDNVYVFESGSGFCVWQNDYKASKKECTHTLTIFKKEKGGLYSRGEEVQKQKYFPPSTVKKCLADAGFTLLFEGADARGTALRGDENDLFYLARCEK